MSGDVRDGGAHGGSLFNGCTTVTSIGKSLGALVD